MVETDNGFNRAFSIRTDMRRIMLRGSPRSFWIQEDNMKYFKLKGYSSVIAGRSYNKSGGVLAYVRSGINYFHTVESNESAEMLKIRVPKCLQGGADLTLLVVYRSHSETIDSFLNKFKETVRASQLNTIILGDININILDENNSATLDYLDLMHAEGFKTMIKEVTREESNSCLDHVMVKTRNLSNFKVNPLKTQITDHYSQMIEIHSMKPTERTINKSFQLVDSGRLKDLVRRVNWGFVYDEANSIGSKFDSFLSILDECRKGSMYTINLTSKTRRRNPWVTQDLVKLTGLKNDLHKKWTNAKKNNRREAEIAQAERNYRNLAKEVTFKIKKAKEEHFRSKFEGCENDPKIFWKTVNSLTKAEKETQIKMIRLNENEVEVAGNEELIANHFNRYYTGIAETLLQNVTPHQAKALDPLAPAWREERMGWKKVSEREVIGVIRSLKNKKSSGHDGWTAEDMKSIVDHVVPPLTSLINESLAEGYFPETLKAGVVVPIYKNGPKNEMRNYRPISLLCVLSKIIERVVKRQLLEFLNAMDFFSSSQFGFLEGKSTDHAVAEHVQSIVMGLESRRRVGALYLDLAKAFDLVNVDLLLTKLLLAGVRDAPGRWFGSFLTERRQSVKLGERLSQPEPVRHGVPQGSTLAPILFLIYLNDICDVEIQGKFFCFADDTALVWRSDSVTNLVSQVERDMREVSAWFMKNKLVLNAEKSKLIHFRYTSLHLPKEIAVVIHRAECGGPSPCTCPVVRESESARYLGMTVDNRLTWGQHVDLLRSRLSRLVYGLRILKPMLDLEARIRLYQAIFLATLRYGIIHYGGTFVSVTRRLFSVLRLSQKIVGIQKGDQSGLIQGFEGLYYQASFMWVAKNLHRYTIDRQESSRLTRRGKYLRLALPRVDHDH
ncbi:unnamed protein product, partial [Nesidiocoris tenuis]